MPPILPPLVAGSSDRWSTAAPACAVAVGNFDGVHRGHAAIVERLRAAAGRLALPAVVLSFEPHPAPILRPATAPVPLTTARRRAALLEALGVDAVLVQPTDRDLMALSAERFFTDVLRGRLGARAVVVGADFRFGAGRGGDVELLGRLCAADAVELETVSPGLVDGLPVSSSRVRSLVAAGAVRDAARLLTAPYRLSGRVVAGDGSCRSPHAGSDPGRRGRAGDLDRPRHIGGVLRPQGVDRVESHSVAQPVEEVNVERGAVERA
ncbi:MAG: hypothetical protein ACKOTB_19345 [Planctomycetia bacterium]